MNELWDRIGISTSLLCVIHCLFSPLLVLMMPIAGGFLSEQWFHWIIAAIVIPVAIASLWWGYRRHRHPSVLVLGGIGIALIAIGLYLPTEIPTDHLAASRIAIEHVAHAHNNPWSILTMVVAGLVLASAHFINLRYHRQGHCRPSPR